MIRRLNTRDLDYELEALRARLREMGRLADNERPERRMRALQEFCFFCATYFPHIQSNRSNRFHDWLYGEAPTWGPGDRIEIAAPRGNAKTTLITRLYTLWRLARNDCHNVIIISDTIDQAKRSLEAIEVELEDNPRLADDFPELAGKGRVWQAELCITRTNILISAAGAGKRIRGLNFRGHRPDLIILDDLENDENSRTRAQRDKLEHWFTHTVLYLGPPDHSETIIYVGTYLHYDGLMARIRRRGDFEHHKFRALIRYPERMDLWQEWELIWKDDQESARRYYEDSKEDMDRGAEVLWPEVQPLYALMEARAADRRAFNAELQNEPLDEETRVFKPETFQYWAQLPPLIYFGAVDPAMGKTRGDYSACVVVGRDKDNRIYVVHALIARIPPMRLIQEIIALQRKYSCVRWGIEEVAFQEFFRTILLQEGLKHGYPVPAIGLKQHAAKAIRVESLAPHIENGVILFSHEQTELLSQLEFYPMADHDDGPDALEMAFRLAYMTGPIEFKAASIDRMSMQFRNKRGY